ncbi:MAG: alpha/beta hydrolase [Candidatus Dormiibacterota bacterium]
MYIEDHQGRLPATVWLHHGVGSTRSWDRFLPASAGGRRAIVYDRRGFGRSTHGRGLTTAMFNEDVADLRAMLTERGVEPVHLVGHSDGGTVALLLAARAPNLVRSVGVVSAHVRGEDTTVATLRRMGPPDQWPEPMRRSLRRSHGDDWIDVAGAWHALWTSSEWERWSIVDELPAIGCPVYAMHALHDDLSPPLHAEAIRDALPSVGITWVDTSSHDPHRVRPERFASDLDSLWRTAEDAGD